MSLSDVAGTARLCLIASLVALGAVAAQAQISPDPNSPGPGGDDCYYCDVGRDLEPDRFNAPVRVRTAQGVPEWVIIGPSRQAAGIREAIESAGGRVTRTDTLDALGETTVIALFPNDAARQAAQEALARLAPDAALSAHHVYRFAQSRQPRIYAPMLIGEAQPGNCRLARPVTIGMIDGPINTQHPALRGVDVTYETLSTGNRQPDAGHGTAVAVLMVGEDPSGLLAGFARGARLHAVSVFSDTEEGAETTVESIAAGIDLLAGRGVRLINLSLAGPENPALGRAIAAAAARGVVMVGASGNDRRPVVAWPAAAPEVIAVTAIDAARRRFHAANTGEDIEFAAPGVDVYVARESGAGYASGTSFAAPIVTALAARQMARGASSADAIRAVLRDGVEVLGPGTRNAEFGYGLVRSGGC
jgi:hypothetical protein